MVGYDTVRGGAVLGTVRYCAVGYGAESCGAVRCFAVRGVGCGG